MVLRLIPDKIPTLDDLQFPARLKEVALEKRGLVFFAGVTGSGKSTSLAAMIACCKEHTHGHIVTIEDPTEFAHSHENCPVSQREVGVDTDSWEGELKSTLRQAPELILIGKIRDCATIENAIAFARAGHLAIGHATCQQCQSGAGPNHQLFPPRAARAIVGGLVAQPGGHRLAAAGAP